MDTGLRDFWPKKFGEVIDFYSLWPLDLIPYLNFRISQRLETKTLLKYGRIHYRMKTPQFTDLLQSEVILWFRGFPLNRCESHLD
jgi:hypothetical protein